MSIASMKAAVSGYFDKLAEARFRRDGQGRLVFLPMGFGRGRLVPDAARAAELRRASRNLMLFVFVAIIPVVGVASGFLQASNGSFLVFFAACLALGFLVNLYPWWLSRDLPRGEERVSYATASLGSLDRFSTKFLWFGLVTCALFSITGLVQLVVPGARPYGSLAGSIIAVLVFAPLTVFYVMALTKRRRGN